MERSGIRETILVPGFHFIPSGLRSLLQSTARGRDDMTDKAIGSDDMSIPFWIVLILIIAALVWHLFSKRTKSRAVTEFDNYGAWERAVYDEGAIKIYRDSRKHGYLHATNENDDLLYGQWHEKADKGQVYDPPYHFRQVDDKIHLVKRLG
jgi:hypothetical protein